MVLRALSIDELRHLIVQLKLPLLVTELERVFQRLDPSHSGRIGFRRFLDSLRDPER